MLVCHHSTYDSANNRAVKEAPLFWLQGKTEAVFRSSSEEGCGK